MVFELAPLLLPCEKCRKHYSTNAHKAYRMLRGFRPDTGEKVFQWLYYLKDEVNKSSAPKAASPPLADITQRFEFSNGSPDDVLSADTILLLAISAEECGKVPLFCDFCHKLAEIFPLPADSQLVAGLRGMKGPSAVSHAFLVTKCVRAERGLPASLSLAKLKQIAAS